MGGEERSFDVYSVFLFFLLLSLVGPKMNFLSLVWTPDMSCFMLLLILMDEKYFLLQQLVIYETSASELDIIRDISRTFPSHVFFQQRHGPGQRSLYNVLKAYSVFDRDVGYVQVIPNLPKSHQHII